MTKSTHARRFLSSRQIEWWVENFEKKISLTVLFDGTTVGKLTILGKYGINNSLLGVIINYHLAMARV